MLDSKCAQNGGHDPSWLGAEFCKNIIGYMMKYILVKLKMIFGKNYEYTMRHL
jgi:hypothetical protein